ncbi:component of oligomeric golgi complex 6 [Guillardia theta CCMP2712]|uniref:Conserved oligomeric Golgi complex subunit 6 n=1 Tax=Guillardia theta (strain CCMP2712) TaxID=905079 RepID=L1IZP2_GUITC|nr:component of oligomeric golgi complex 6 [Guillardia theta CCMP2712]EKX41562.1 component of oligomeric golgi complex 6 [Guillardia theta CCMP2712]|eukprot:XP_005828542.1 component of oligomeric golgi complex 6 [Guillardia theta CCMP2712]
MSNGSENHPSAGSLVGGPTPSPAIAKKVKKVVELRLDAPELSAALDQLTEFYGANTLENRRNLKSCIEKRGIDVNHQFINCFEDVMKKLDHVENYVMKLSDCSQRMQQRLHTAQTTTAQVLKLTEQLQKKEHTAEAHKNLVLAFLDRFRLKPSEMQLLQTGEVSDPFLEVLDRVGQIQSESKQLLRVHHKTALMDIVDEAASLQEKGFDRLYRWLQKELSNVQGDSSDVPLLVKKGLKTLRSRSALYKVCLEDLAVSRRQALHKRFVAALSRGGPGGTPKPIEIHAHDPLRYIGDMLAWVHQALASERELLASLFIATRPDSSEPSKMNSVTARVEEDKVLAGVLDGVSSTVQARVEAVLQSQSSAVLIFKLGNLLLFYLHTIGGLLPDGASLTSTIQGCHKLAGKLFMELLTASSQRLYKQPPPCPSTLAPHNDILAALEELKEVMSSFDASLIPARLRENYFKPVVEEGVEPLIGACALSANAITPAEGSIYLVNCLLAIQTLLQRYDFCAWRIPRLQNQIAQALEQGIKEQVLIIMRQCNLDDKMYSVRSWKSEQRGEGMESLSGMVGMDPLALSISLKQFYGVVLTSSLEYRYVDRLSTSSIRSSARSKVAAGITQSYKELYDAIISPESGYREPHAILLHGPQQIESLLMGSV